MLGITSSTTRMVVSSRQVASAASPVLVRVVTPRITEHTPPTSSTGVTPPWRRVSTSLSLYRVAKLPIPWRAAPPKGRAGSASPQMAPARAAATRAPPSWAVSPGATSTTRSLLRLAARVVSWVTVSPAPPGTTAMRSFRSWAADAAWSRRACCTVRVSLSQTTTFRFSSWASRAKAAAYPLLSSTGTASTRAAPLAMHTCTSWVRLSSLPKAWAASAWVPRG